MQSIDLLLTRRSTPLLTEPAPNEQDLQTILKAGMRVPDHGGLTPWHFTVVKNEGLKRLSTIFVDAAKQDKSDEVKLAKVKKMPFRAPLIIIISTDVKPHDKVPKQEQIIAAGCCVHAMQMTAFALGYGAMWRTGDFSYHPFVKKQLNVANENEIVGFLYIGTPTKQLADKPSKTFEPYVSYL